MSGPDEPDEEAPTFSELYSQVQRLTSQLRYEQHIRVGVEDLLRIHMQSEEQLKKKVEELESCVAELTHELEDLHWRAEDEGE